MRKDLLFILIFWGLWYGIMYLLGRHPEKRDVPLLPTKQSWVYFPGEMAIPVMIVALWHEWVRVHDMPAYAYSNWFTLLTIVVVFGAVFFVVKHDRDCYRKLARKRGHADLENRAVWSPTKGFHDALGYFVALTCIIRFAAPLIIEAATKHITLDKCNALHFIGALAVYGLTIYLDSLYPATDDAVYARHAFDWGIQEEVAEADRKEAADDYD